MSPSFPSHTIPFPRDNHAHHFPDITFHRDFIPILYADILPEIFYSNTSKYVYIQGPAQVTPPFYYKIISMEFCNMTVSHSSTPYDILGEMFRVKL